MHIVLVLDSLANSGTEKSTAELAAYFAKKHTVTVVYFYPNHSLLTTYQLANANVVFLPDNGIIPFAKGIRSFYRYCLLNQPNVVISSLFRANLIARLVCMYAKIPLLGTFVSDSYHHLRIQSLSTKQRLGFLLTKTFDRCTAHIPSAYIANAQCIANSNAQHLGITKQKIHVVYRGRDAKMFGPWQAPLASNAFIWVVIGRLISTKGCLEIVTAFTALHKHYPNMQLHFYGDGNLKTHLQEKIYALQLQQSVYIHGNISMAWQKIYEAHAFVFASWYEGFSGALVEAMLTGVPIVASNIPMNLEAVTHNTTARIFQVQNVTDLQTQMLWIFQNYSQAQLLGQQARKEALARFDMQQIGANYLQIVEQYCR